MIRDVFSTMQARALERLRERAPGAPEADLSAAATGCALTAIQGELLPIGGLLTNCALLGRIGITLDLDEVERFACDACDALN